MLSPVLLGNATIPLQEMLRVVRLERPHEGLSREVTAPDELWPLARAASAGDVVALRTLLTRVAPTLLRVVRRVTGAQHPEVEDVTQECAVEFVEALQRFRGESSVQHFASRVALRVAMNARRGRLASKRSAPELELVDADEAAGAQTPPDEQAASRACLELARGLCDELPLQQAEALALHCVLGYTMSEVATICCAPLETVRSRLRAGKAALMARARMEPRLRELLEEAR
jgi:RNA polymerase sigma-70 factor (ECF subfamily)